MDITAVFLIFVFKEGILYTQQLNFLLEMSINVDTDVQFLISFEFIEGKNLQISSSKPNSTRFMSFDIYY